MPGKLETDFFHRKFRPSANAHLLPSWCSPCKALAPRLENIVSEQGGRVRLARVDIDEHGELAMDYNVGSVPSLVVINKGKVVNRMVGLQTSEYIRDWLKKVMSHDEN